MAINVGFTRPELSGVLALYYLIRDCLAGEPVIKEAGKKYLPIPNPEDTSKENIARYIAYKTRAVFYNVTRRTLAGLVGQLFIREPVIKVPSQLDLVIKDVNGEGIPIQQQAMRTCQYATAYSRCGLFVDYPMRIEGVGTTIAQIASGEIKPTITQYPPWQIINWRTILNKETGKTILSLVVIQETYCVEDDGFEMKNSGQFRVLKLNSNGNYIQEIWRENQPTKFDSAKNKPLKGNFEVKQVINMTGGDGLPMKEIPFMFVGSENNDSAVDNPNMYDLASINIAHYRNSADYEESCYVVGQPTPVLIGLTEDWVKNVLKGVVAFGSRGGIPLPVGADAKLLQAEENTMIKEAMDTKERQMIALGAKLIQQKEVQRTAFETKVDASAEGSVLSNIAKNVSSAYVWALEWCCRFVNIPEAGIEFKLNDDFDVSAFTPEQITALVKNWQAGALTWEEMRNGLKKAGQATEDDEEAKQKIADDQAIAIEKETNAAVAIKTAGAGATA